MTLLPDGLRYEVGAVCLEEPDTFLTSALEAGRSARTVRGREGRRSAGGEPGHAWGQSAIVQQLTEAHGGTILVDSVLGQGSLFTVHLPVPVSGSGATTSG